MAKKSVTALLLIRPIMIKQSLKAAQNSHKNMPVTDFFIKFSQRSKSPTILSMSPVAVVAVAVSVAVALWVAILVVLVGILSGYFFGWFGELRFFMSELGHKSFFLIFHQL